LEVPFVGHLPIEIRLHAAGAGFAQLGVEAGVIRIGSNGIGSEDFEQRDRAGEPVRKIEFYAHLLLIGFDRPILLSVEGQNAEGVEFRSRAVTGE
jgi:hypothetical protein